MMISIFSNVFVLAIHIRVMPRVWLRYVL